jgi:hypothetical protein
MEAKQKQELCNKLTAVGEKEFILFVVELGKKNLDEHPPGRKKPTVDTDLLSLSVEFFNEYKLTKNADFFHVSKCIRSAAHKIHRIMLKRKLTSNSKKFIRSV